MNEIIFGAVSLFAVAPLAAFAITVLVRDLKKKKQPVISGCDEEITTDTFGAEEALRWFRRNSEEGASYAVMSLSESLGSKHAVKGEDNLLLLSVIGADSNPRRICLVRYLRLTEALEALLRESDGVFYAEIGEAKA